MRSERRLTLLAYNAAAALAGVAAMFVIVRTVMQEPGTTESPAAVQSTAPDAPARIGRLAFVQGSALLQPKGPVNDPDLRPTIPATTEGSATWSTEVVTEATPQAPARQAWLPSLRLPWQTAKPGTQQRYATLKARLAEVSPAATARLTAKFEAAKAIWPPAEIALIAIKDEKALELRARPRGGAWTLVHRYRVLAASGGPGPKLRQGDKQVPEGVYGIALLNPNSAYHLSLRVNYPNAFDRQMAAREARKDLGGDIMIHGKNLSAGCLAVGDEAVEELFVLVAQTGLPNIKLIIAPTDFRERGIPSVEAGRPDWLPQLYSELASAMAEFKDPRGSNGLLSFFTR